VIYHSQLGKTVPQPKGNFLMELIDLPFHGSDEMMNLGLWPGSKWAGFGQTGLLKTDFNTKRFHSVWVTSKTGLNRVITRVNKKNGLKKITRLLLTGQRCGPVHISG
jgi:hypothetical protein